MLFHLPNELVLWIIELSIQPLGILNKYGSRLAALCNYCLVSRRLRQFAQPLLFADVRLETLDKVASFQAVLKDSGLAAAVKVFHFFSYPPNAAASEVEAVIAMCPSLRALELYRLESFDMSCLDGHAALERLELCEMRLTATKPILLPRLDCLILSCCSAEQDTQRQLLSLTTQPLLQYVDSSGETLDRSRTINHPSSFEAFPLFNLFGCNEEDPEHGDTDSDEEGGTDETQEADAAEIETGGEQER
ncbi:hypothetical protein JCM1840_003428 [Sporobolomyces johnsonii]